MEKKKKKDTTSASANPMEPLKWINPTYLLLLCPSLTLLGVTNGAFTLDVKLVLNENLGGILGGT